MSKKKRAEPSDSQLCVAANCGRRAYARGLCQTHHRQMLTLGRVKPIRHYRRSAAKTVKYAGFRLTPDCVEEITRKAEEEGLSRGAAIAKILEEWIQGLALRRP